MFKSVQVTILYGERSNDQGTGKWEKIEHTKTMIISFDDCNNPLPVEEIDYQFDRILGQIQRDLEG